MKNVRSWVACATILIVGMSIFFIAKHLTAMTPTPDSTAQAPAPMPMSTPDQAPPAMTAMPTPDATAQAPAPAPMSAPAQTLPGAPTPDQTQIPPPATPDGMAPAPTATPAPTPEITPTQIGWPDAPELDESKTGLAQSSNPKIFELFKQADETLEKIASSIDQMTKTRQALYSSFFELDAKIEDLYQSTSFGQGMVKQALEPIEATKK